MTVLAWRMAWREIRAHWSRFVFFASSVSIGVSAIVAVDQVSENVARAIHRDAKSLLGGDIALTLSHRLSSSSQRVLASLADRGVTVIHVRELIAMATRGPMDEPGTPEGATTQLVEVKAVPRGYPLFGMLEIDPPQTLARALAPHPQGCQAVACYGALVEESLLFHLRGGVGSVIKLGQVHLKITGIVVKEPDRVATAFRLGPRVIVSQEALEATRLVQPGSRVRERYLLRVPPAGSLDKLARELRGRLASEGVRIVTYHDAQPRIRRFLDQLSTYLRLIGLTALFIGGIGMALTIHGHLANKMVNIAILKTVGADSTMIFYMYVLQSVLIAALGCVGGMGLGLGIQAGVAWVLGETMSLSIPYHISLVPIVKGGIIGLATAVAFTLWPLLAVRQVPPALVLRRHIGAVGLPDRSSGRHSFWKTVKLGASDRPRLLIGLGMGSCLIGLAVWQAGSFSLALFFIAAVIGAMIVLALLAQGAIRAMKRFPAPPSLLLRCALQNLCRPGNYTLGMIVAIGLSVMMMTGILFSEYALVHALVERIPDRAPSFFFIDIQPDQRVAFERVLRSETGEERYRVTPVIRARLAAINGAPLDPQAYRGERDGWYFTREYVLTALERLPEGNRIVRGRWWEARESGQERPSRRSSGPILVSVEEEAARRLHVEVGDTVTFNIQGADLTATVASLRAVDWSSFSMNFFMILSPGSLADLPFTYIAAAHVERDREASVQRALVRALPNVTAIKVGDVLHLVIVLIQRVAWAVEGLALFCLANGAMVVAAALSSTWYRRIFESAMLKVFGATRRTILWIFAVEFLIVGIVAGIVGVGLAVALSWGIVRYFLDVPWAFAPALTGLVLAVTTILALALGFLGTYRLLAYPPLRVLRGE